MEIAAKANSATDPIEYSNRGVDYVVLPFIILRKTIDDTIIYGMVRPKGGMNWAGIDAGGEGIVVRSNLTRLKSSFTGLKF